MASLGNKSEKGSILRERVAITWQEVVLWAQGVVSGIVYWQW